MIRDKFRSLELAVATTIQDEIWSTSIHLFHRCLFLIRGSTKNQIKRLQQIRVVRNGPRWKRSKQGGFISEAIVQFHGWLAK